MKTSIITLVTVLLLASCGKEPSGQTTYGGNPVGPTPANPVLTSPAQNETCITGTIISATEDSVTFSWNPTANTDDYFVYLVNLLTTKGIENTSSSTNLTLTLLRNTPYAWFVESHSKKTPYTGKSDTWKFYNSGPGVVSYPPFPAEITAPVFGQEITAAAVNLSWTGSITSPGVILNYDVYFGKTATPALLKGALTSSALDSVSVSSGNTYYWKVITRDTNGDTSDSGLYQFSIK